MKVPSLRQIVAVHSGMYYIVSNVISGGRMQLGTKTLFRLEVRTTSLFQKVFGVDISETGERITSFKLRSQRQSSPSRSPPRWCECLSTLNFLPTLEEELLMRCNTQNRMESKLFNSPGLRVLHLCKGFQTWILWTVSHILQVDQAVSNTETRQQLEIFLTVCYERIIY